MYILNAQYRQAIEFINRQEPTKDLLYQKVICCKYLNDYSTAIEILNAFVYYNLNSYDIAIERFEKCLQQGDSSLIVNRSLGFSYFLTEKDSLAHPFLQQAFLQDTTNTNVLYILGKVNFKLGYYPEAAECFVNLVEKIVPSRVLLFSVYKELALAYEKNGTFEEASRAYNSALNYAKDNKDNMELYFSMATITDKELKNTMLAVYYYKEYRRCLFNYQSSLTDEKEIDEIEFKLTALDEYIRLLTEEEMKKKN